MVTAHRELDGSWTACPAPDEPGRCMAGFHMRNTEPAVLTAMPARLLWPLLAAIDPPAVPATIPGAQAWLDEDGELHRDFDLPALIWENGQVEWWWHGVPHRNAAGPALIRPDGGLEYYLHGTRLTGQR